MTVLMLTVPLAGCVGGSDDSDDEPAPIDIMGCMDDAANNYDSAATVDDGSCEFDEDPTDIDFDGIAGFDASSIQCGPTGDISIAGSNIEYHNK